MSSEQFFRTIYEDKDIVVIDKEHGVHVIEDRYDKNLPTIRGMLNSIYGKVFIVHRLDSGTGGLLVVAKNENSHRALSLQFEEGLVRKRYYALVVGKFSYPLTCMLPISKVNYHGRYKINFKSGRRAITSFYPIKIYDNKTLLDVVPLTGRSHQIRVHLKALKHPLMNDFLYNVKTDDKRLTLQAYELIFNHPTRNEEMVFRVDISGYMKDWLSS
ncbi:MAG: RluA family pseudouridine synthase [Deferribacterales bacterium]